MGLLRRSPDDDTRNRGLDPEFSKWLEGYVAEMLDLHARARPSPRVSKVWGCRNLGDFMCGFFVGEMMGAASATFQARHRRPMSAEEHEAISGVVERHAQEARAAFLKYNGNDGTGARP